MPIILKLDQKTPSKTDIKEEIDRYKESLSTPQGMLDLFGSIFELQSEYLERIDPLRPELSEEEINASLKRGEPLLPTAPRGEVPPVLFKEMLARLALIIDERIPRKIAGLGRLMGGSGLGIEEVGPFVEKFEAGDDRFFEQLAREWEIEKSVILFMATQLLNPFYDASSQGLRPKINHHNWGREICPVCGGKPFIAKLRREDGLKILCCDACNTQWWIQRIHCAHCGNTESRGFTLFSIEEDQAHQLEVCNECKRYIKLVGEGMAERQPIPRVEDVATIKLDMIAKKKGYLPLVQMPAGQSRLI
ncbi:MAG: formate dehydrogenase accessory protein FdhE [Actinomycetota bacterium]|nr:formate dehydrogenase accessory protein FdhE [Actinomycetota bacterium]